MIFRGKKPVTAFLAVAALVTAFIASGCSGNNNTSTTGWTLVGKVIDANSRAGVPGARVCVKINGDWNGHCAKSSTGASGNLTANTKPKYDATTTVGSTVGDFSITGLPYLSMPTPVSVQAPVGSTYSDTTVNVTFDLNTGSGASAGNANGQFDMGVVAIDKGVTVNIFVVSTNGAGGAASPVNTNGAPVWFATSGNGDVLDVPATYVSGNQYTITLPRTGAGAVGLPVANFLVISPFKSASGAYFQGATTNVVWQDLTVEVNPTINLTVVATSMVTPLTTVATNFITMTDNSVVTSAGVPGAGVPIVTNGLAKNGVIKLYLNEPITLPTMTSVPACPTGEICPVSNPYVIALSYVDYFKKLTATAATVTQAVTAAVDATDLALLTITPANDLIENQTYAFAGRVQAASDWASQPGTNADTSVNLDTVVNGRVFYIYPASATVAGAIGPIQVDNGNGWTAFAAGVVGASSVALPNETTMTVTSATAPFLLFPEMVWGTVRLIDYPGTALEFNPHALTGTVMYNTYNLVNTRAGVQVTGNGTKFDVELQIGDEITDANGIIWKVISIDSATSMVATSTNNSSVPNQGLPGATATVTLREGFYTSGMTNALNDTLLGSQRVASTYVQDAKAGDVLSVGANQVTVLSVANPSAGSGLGRELVVSMGPVSSTGSALIVENSGKGWLAGGVVSAIAPAVLATGTPGFFDDVTIYGAWGSPVSGLGPYASVLALNALVASGDVTTQNNVPPVPNLYASPVTNIISALPLVAGVGAGYTTGALSLATGHQAGACSGVTFTTVGATLVGGAITATGSNCKSGDILAVYTTGGATPTTGVGLIQLTVTNGTGTATAAGYQILLDNVSYIAGAYNTSYVGTYLNNNVSPAASVAGGDGTLTAPGTGIVAASTTNGGIDIGLAVQSGGVNIGNNRQNLGPAGSAINTSCTPTQSVACFASFGSAGAIAGDVITVFNPYVGLSSANLGVIPVTAPAGFVTSPSNGTIRITAVDSASGRVSAGVVTSSGAFYPSAAAGTLYYFEGGVTTHFTSIVLSGGVTAVNTVPNVAYATNGATVTLGSNTARGITNDLKKFGGPQVRALEDYVLANAGSPADIAGLTYSIEYTAACGLNQINGGGPKALPGNLAAVYGQIAWLDRTVDSGNLFNIGGFDWTAGPALVCNMKNPSMFGWALGGGHTIPAGGPLAGYAVSDSTSGTPLQIRLDINVVDMAGNSLKATDQSYDVH
ncbi:MAG: hypothetical protein HY098_02720 [Nitrospinae bacterium]|nr:hypothetical protein [Nitrospinota bacterium]